LWFSGTDTRWLAPSWDQPGDRQRPGTNPVGYCGGNRLQPEFVVSLGDLVEGYTAPSGAPADEATYREWWREIDQYIGQLEMPLFFIADNHDLNNPASVTVWRERFGGDRQYYHFRYQDVLFLMLSTEDPPKDTDALLENDDPEHAKVLDDAYHAVKEAIAEGAGPDRVLALLEPIEEYLGTVNISEEQIDYFRGVLKANADVRWTFVMMHAPAWINPSGQELDPADLAEIEALLAERPYTVFAAHTHKYLYNERYGRDNFTAMTGAHEHARHEAIDHIVWVTMTDDGPRISNLLLNGILDKHGPVEGDHTVEFGMYHPAVDGPQG
jgi:hypothetical protein